MQTRLILSNEADFGAPIRYAESLRAQLMLRAAAREKIRTSGQ